MVVTKPNDPIKFSVRIKPTLRCLVSFSLLKGVDFHWWIDECGEMQRRCYATNENVATFKTRNLRGCIRAILKIFIMAHRSQRIRCRRYIVGSFKEWVISVPRLDRSGKQHAFFATILCGICNRFRCTLLWRCELQSCCPRVGH